MTVIIPYYFGNITGGEHIKIRGSRGNKTAEHKLMEALPLVKRGLEREKAWKLGPRSASRRSFSLTICGVFLPIRFLFSHHPNLQQIIQENKIICVSPRNNPSHHGPTQVKSVRARRCKIIAP